MTPEAHRNWVDLCTRLAEREFADGRSVSGSEMAWGAAVHAVKCIAHQHPALPTHSHAALGLAVIQLDNRHTGLNLTGDFGQAEVLHRHFYRGHLQSHQVRNSWRLTRRLIGNLLALTALP